MALFSPPIMAEFQTETLLWVQNPSNVGKPSPTQVYRWAGTHSAFMDFIRRAQADGTVAAEHLTRQMARNDRETHWSAITEPMADFLASGVSKDAHREFSAAVARLHADRLTPGRVRPMVAGGAWVVPLVLASNPLPSRIRERTKLPPVRLDIGVSVMAMTDWKDITASLAPLAHAAWEYIQQGGSVDLTTHYTMAFSAPQDGHQGLVFSVKAPLTSQAGFATAVSVQTHRCLALRIGQALSGEPGGRDSMPLAYWHKPGLFTFNGQGDGDKKALAALKIA